MLWSCWRRSRVWLMPVGWSGLWGISRVITPRSFRGQMNWSKLWWIWRVCLRGWGFEIRGLRAKRDLGMLRNLFGFQLSLEGWAGLSTSLQGWCYAVPSIHAVCFEIEQKLARVYWPPLWTLHIDTYIPLRVFTRVKILAGWKWWNRRGDDWEQLFALRFWAKL